MLNTLETADVRLLEGADRDRIVRQYNRVVEQYNMFQTAFGDEYQDDPELMAAKKSLTKLRRAITREHFQIAFIGKTGVGKSKALNSIIGPSSDGTDPFPSSAGKSITTAVTRLRYAESESLSLHYMDEEQYQKKRDFLCHCTGLSPELSNQELLVKLAEHPAIRSDRGATLADGESINPEDVKALKDLIKTAESRAALINSPPSRDKDFTDRERYVANVVGADTGNSLLWDVRLGMPVDFLTSNVELFDLPGPGAASKVDGWTAKEHLENVHAVLLLANPERIETEVETWLMEQMRSWHGRRRNRRIWLIITRWDNLMEDGLEGSAKMPNPFDSLDQFLERYDMDISRVYMICAAWANASQEAVHQHFAARLRNADNDPLPSRLQSDERAGMRRAFLALFNKGGFPALRELLRNSIATSVRDELIEESRRELGTLRQSLAARFRRACKRATTDDQDVAIAREASSKLQLTLLDIEKEREEFERQAVRLRDELRERFRELWTSAEAHDRFANADEKFRSDTKELESTLAQTVRDEILQTLYHDWRPRFEELPEVELPTVGDESATPLEIWDTHLQSDQEADVTGIPMFPSFLDRTLFVGGHENLVRDLAKGVHYEAMFQEKTRTVAQQAIHSIRSHLLARAGTIERHVRDLVRAENVSRQSDAPCTKLQARMDELEQDAE
ncbi:P-loop NTPase family protein [Thalassoroseus pseudoceratinae]|uniref:hypothetical protein n=1 Tax=Thalassoroseus pseudoceratinae TaxID=2713176 RepID=UPI001420EF6B|nr:hypothetical protein [Thalassoroseus pseudoceratinae]